MISLRSLERHGRVEYYNGKSFGKKRIIKVEKKEDENFQLFMQNSYRIANQVLITTTSILSDHENVVFILIYKIFPKI